MSSAAYIHFENGTVGVSIEDWRSFCAEHCIEHSPRTVGGNVYYLSGLNGGVEIGYESHRLSFSTFWMGEAMAEVARIAVLSWRRWGGSISAAPEIRQLIAGGG